MIGQLRLFRLVVELLWTNGLLVGFTLPDRNVNAVGINFGSLCLCLYFDDSRPVCASCGGTLGWGLHGNLGPVRLCKPAAAKPCGW